MFPASLYRRVSRPRRNCADRTWRCSVWLAAALALGPQVWIGPASAQDAVLASDAASRKEFQVRYAFLYSFALMTKWPDEAFSATGDDFVIAVVGETPYRADLDRLAETKKIRERSIKIVRVDKPDAPPACQILYVPATVAPELRVALVKKLAGQPVLLVGESPGFATAGGVVRFFVESDNVRFELNPTAAAAQGLAVDPRMTKLAKVVGQEKAAAPPAAPADAGGK